MADFGFYVYDDNNNLQADDTFLLFYVRKSGTVTVSGTGVGAAYDVIISGTSTYPNAFIAFSNTQGYYVTIDLNGAYGSGFRFLTNAPPGTVFDYYIMDRSSAITPLASGDYGYEIYDESGNVTLTNKQMLCSTIDINTNRTEPTMKLGFAVLVFSGQNLYDDPQSGDPSQYWHSFYGRGACTDGTNHSVTLGDVIIEQQDVTGVRPPASNQFDVTGSVLILDLTGIPVGGTFF